MTKKPKQIQLQAEEINGATVYGWKIKPPLSAAQAVKPNPAAKKWERDYWWREQLRLSDASDKGIQRFLRQMAEIRATGADLPGLHELPKPSMQAIEEHRRALLEEYGGIEELRRELQLRRIFYTYARLTEKGLDLFPPDYKVLGDPQMLAAIEAARPFVEAFDPELRCHAIRAKQEELRKLADDQIIDSYMAFARSAFDHGKSSAIEAEAVTQEFSRRRASAGWFWRRWLRPATWARFEFARLEAETIMEEKARAKLARNRE
jgi:hypothetical protein